MSPSFLSAFLPYYYHHKYHHTFFSQPVPHLARPWASSLCHFIPVPVPRSPFRTHTSRPRSHKTIDGRKITQSATDCRAPPDRPRLNDSVIGATNDAHATDGRRFWRKIETPRKALVNPPIVFSGRWRRWRRPITSGPVEKYCLSKNGGF